MSKPSPIFKDPALQQHFEQYGYAVVKLLDETKTLELYNFYLQHQKEHDAIGSRYQATTHTNDPELILKTDEQIKAVLLPEVEKHFEQYEPMMCTYITKRPGEGSETRLHQDPTFVDETQYVSANIWVALHDINHQNGNLFFVKGTHRFMPSLRVTPNCPTAYDKVKDLLEQNLTEVPVKAGEAIIINHAVMHGATPNMSQGPRVAAVMAVRSKGSSWIYHYLEPGAPFDKIEKYGVNLQTFVTLHKDGRPSQAENLGYVSWHFPQMEREAFIAQTNALTNNGFMGKLKNIGKKIFA